MPRLANYGSAIPLGFLRPAKRETSKAASEGNAVFNDLFSGCPLLPPARVDTAKAFQAEKELPRPMRPFDSLAALINEIGRRIDRLGESPAERQAREIVKRAAMDGTISRVAGEILAENDPNYIFDSCFPR